MRGRWHLGILCGILLWGSSALATHLTEAQYTTLNNYLNGIDALDDEILTQDWDGLAAYCNATASPSYWVWRPVVTEEEITRHANWIWLQYISKTVNQQGGWTRMFRTGAIDMSSASIRAGLSEIFFGQSNLTHLLTIGRRQATRCEQLYSLSIGTGTTVNPDTMGYEGSITSRDTAHAFGFGPAHE